jgi:hypothetical protein
MPTVSDAKTLASQFEPLPSLEEQRRHFISHLPEGEIGVSFDRGLDGKPNGSLSFEDEVEVWRRVDQLTAKGHDVFITTAAFANKFGTPRPDGNGRFGRTSDNVACIGALVGDIDVARLGQPVTGSAFRDRDEARAGLDRICQSEGLPTPSMLIGSGNGLHPWWMFDGAVSPAEGKNLRQCFCEAVTGIDPRMTVDKSRWRDINGLLRPVGSLNFKARKGDPAKGIAPAPGHPGDPVEMLSMHDRAISPEDVKAWIAAAKRRFMVPVTLPKPQQPATAAVTLVPPNPNVIGFDISVAGHALDQLISIQANIGNVGFENLVAGLINAARTTDPRLVPAVEALLLAKLPSLPNWQNGVDEKRIASFVSATIPSNPRSFATFCFEVEKHVRSIAAPSSIPETANSACARNVPSAWKPAAPPSNWQDAMAVAKAADLMLGGILIRGKVTSVAAKSGIGKTHFSILIMAHLGGDKDLMGLDDPTNPRQPEDALRVFGLFLEEELSLLGIKAKALTQHYGITINPDRATFCGLECADGLKFWSDGPGGRPVIDEAGFLGIDELASAHDVLIVDALGLVLENSTGTNDSTVAATTMKRLNKIASKHDCAILLVMHERKAKAGPDGRDADNVTGVAQWISHGRGNYTLSEMDAATAKNFGIDPDDAYRYLLAKPSKLNHAAKKEAIWFKKVTVAIPGEKHPVMVLERWKPPSVTAKAAGLATNAQAIALKVIDDAEKAGTPLSTAGVNQAQKNGYPTCAIGEVAIALRATDPNATQGYAEQTADTAILTLEKQGKIIRKTAPDRRRVWSVV